MSGFKPDLPYTTAIELLIPTYTTQKGVRVKTFPDHGIRLNCSFKTYGGSEYEVNGTTVVLDTAWIETWYRPDIASDCRIKVLQTGKVYEIMIPPENIEMRNQFCKFKVKAFEGGA